MHRRRPALRIPALALVLLGLTACADGAERSDASDEPTIQQPAVDEVVTDQP